VVIMECQSTNYLKQAASISGIIRQQKPRGISRRPIGPCKGRHRKAAAAVKGRLTAKSGSEKASLTGANMVMPWLVPFKLYCSPLLCRPISHDEHHDIRNMTADITTLGALITNATNFYCFSRNLRNPHT